MPKNMKALIFAYPISEYIDFSIERAEFLVIERISEYLMERDHMSEDDLDTLAESNPQLRKALQREHRVRTRSILRQLFSSRINRAVQERYRDRGYDVHWVLFAEHQPSPLIEILPQDNIISADISFKTHTTKRPDGTYQYADTQQIIRHVRPYQDVVVTGYHVSDCVDRIAAATHAAGHQTLVDEDLTENFLYLSSKPGFRVHYFPSMKPEYLDNEDENTSEPFSMRELSKKLRAEEQKKRPWLYQWPTT